MASRPKKALPNKLWADALRKAVLKRIEGEHRLDRIAERVVAAAEEGRMEAAKEIGDRLDGKVPQALVGDDTKDPMRLITEVRRTIVRPGNRNG